jgi:hypothetical protein
LFIAEDPTVTEMYNSNKNVVSQVH